MLRAAAVTMGSDAMCQRFEYTKQLDSSREPIFFCDLLGPDGRVCGKGFSDYRQLRSHMTSTRPTGLSTHGQAERDPLRVCVVSNQCPVCRQNYASRASAQIHLKGAYKAGRCRTGLAHFAWELKEVWVEECPMQCGLKVDSFEDLQLHLLEHHLPLPFPTIERKGEQDDLVLTEPRRPTPQEDGVSGHFDDQYRGGGSAVQQEDLLLQGQSDCRFRGENEEEQGGGGEQASRRRSRATTAGSLELGCSGERSFEGQRGQGRAEGPQEGGESKKEKTSRLQAGTKRS